MYKTIFLTPFCLVIVLLLSMRTALYEENSDLNSFQSLIRFQLRRNPGFLISRSLDEGGKNYEPKFELFAICNLFL